jgi:hypothetical protein
MPEPRTTPPDLEDWPVSVPEAAAREAAAGAT